MDEGKAHKDLNLSILIQNTTFSQAKESIIGTSHSWWTSLVWTVFHSTKGVTTLDDSTLGRFKHDVWLACMGELHR
jgi:hypothetical protein